MIINSENYLAHYGILRRSGRYPWGSSNNENTRNKGFLDFVDEMKKKGLSEVEIARGIGMIGKEEVSTTQLRAARTIAKAQQKQAQIGMAQRLKDKGTSNVEIGKRMGLNESSVRALLAPGAKDKANILFKTSEMLKKEVEDKRFVDVGLGVETGLKISKEKLNNAIAVLKEEGYEVHTVKVPQLGTKFETERKVLAAPGTAWKDVAQNKNNIKLISAFSTDNGRTYSKVHDPISIEPNRVGIRYKEDGGGQAEGMIYVRPGIKDISLGKANYAQVRVQVGAGHYLKGMAIYKDDLPPGVDLQFNTGKSSTGNKLDAMKSLSSDPDLPFGAIVRQILEDPGTPKERVSSVMNIVNEEGNWAPWSMSLSSQFLSKQSPKVAKSQLNMTYERRQKNFDEIKSLTNPTVQKKLLNSFADSVDSAAVHLEAAALSTRQSWSVILPVESMPPSQVYATKFRNGERVALVRYPHGGTFEIPDLIVNNNHPEAKRSLGNAVDAIGINPEVAQRLSGADFDGDTVIVIPNNSGKVTISPALEGLKGFDPKASYPAYEGMTPISPARKQAEMGFISNLITDMTIAGAPHTKIVRAIRHSMVVIDSEKHNLNYKQSAIDNGIKELKTEYQGGPRSGASTLISRANSDLYVPERKPRPAALGGSINVTTGAKEYVPTGRTRVNKQGIVVPRTERSTKLAEATDAYTLSSGTTMESIYADHSNKLKSMANAARLAAFKAPPLEYSPSAKKTYSAEVLSLNAKLALAYMNKPLERQAQTIAGSVVSAKRQANPNLDGESIKKIKLQALSEARSRMGANKKESQVQITPKEWDAIQAGAISNSKLENILSNTDIDLIRKLATPHEPKVMTPALITRAKSMLDSGYTRSQIADQLGVSLSTLDTATKQE